MNLIDYILLAVIIGIAGLIIWSMRRRKKKGGSSCGCEGGCASCPMAGKCEEMKKDK